MILDTIIYLIYNAELQMRQNQGYYICPLLVLDHQLPSGLRLGSQSQMCEGGVVDGPNMGDAQVALDEVSPVHYFLQIREVRCKSGNTVEDRGHD